MQNNLPEGFRLERTIRHIAGGMTSKTRSYVVSCDGEAVCEVFVLIDDGKSYSTRKRASRIARLVAEELRGRRCQT